MITSIHTLVCSDDAPATRAFLRDVLGWPHVEDADSEARWLILGTGPSEMGLHPTHSVWEGQEYNSPRHHAIALMCDDIEVTRRDLERKGAKFSAPITDEGYGLVTTMNRPRCRPDHALPAQASNRLQPLTRGLSHPRGVPDRRD